VGIQGRDLDKWDGMGTRNVVYESRIMTHYLVGSNSPTHHSAYAAPVHEYETVVTDCLSTKTTALPRESLILWPSTAQIKKTWSSRL
jgi:hypothetical protein